MFMGRGLSETNEGPLSFFNIRGLPPFFGSNDDPKSGDPHLSLPNSLSNAWKRFMFDFAYGRCAYMLYPNLSGLQILPEHCTLRANNSLTVKKTHFIDVCRW